ncbi:MAG TPA: hypothetical protein VHO70_15340 [Chitinispirillaceae bacterium]|nr:hypothetical protein [Chitinispirillaceae bacterium]
MKNLYVILSMVAVVCAVEAGIQEVVFIGITGDGAPAIEKTFETQLRKRLSTQSSLYLADCIVSQRYARMIKFDYFPVVSRELVESIETFASDTTLFVWGTVKKCNVSTVRKNLLRTVIKGELELSLTVYSLYNRGYSYSGVIYADALCPGEFDLFCGANNTSHIDALKRENVLLECIDNAVTKTTAMINVLVWKNAGEKRVAPTEVEEKNIPSIYDVFTVPSIKAPEIEGQAESNVKKGK